MSESVESTGEKRPLYDGESQGLLPDFHEDSIQIFSKFSKFSLESLVQLLFLFFLGGAKLVKMDETPMLPRRLSQAPLATRGSQMRSRARRGPLAAGPRMRRRICETFSTGPRGSLLEFINY